MKTDVLAKTVRGFAVVLVAVALLAGGVPAEATTVDECQAAIGVLISATSAAESLSNKDAAGLLGKAQNASLKLNQGKFADALQKLLDYQAKINDLSRARKPKISTDDFTTLSTKVADAIACVQRLISGL